ncbi:phosphatase PAP2 family protein [Paenibacillus sp. FSL R5-0407]|uniref:phosphatase PAP2 family protein n=1 Tax=Paenibacillus sp. FSL R5-0407 TaxID=2975320 RepID=UPI0030F65974
MKIWLAAGLMAICFILLGLGIHIEGLHSIDRGIGDFFFGLRTESLNPAIKAMSELGSTTGYIVVLAFVLIITLLLRRWRTAIWLTVSLAAGWLVNKGLKVLYHRERPQLWDSLVEPDGFSFPSGNAMVSIAFYGLIGLILLRSGRRWIRVCGVAVFVIILLIGLSRLYLGVHYTSDIVGGFLAGGCIAALCYKGWRSSSDSMK